MDSVKIDGIEPHVFITCSRRYDDFEENIFSLTWGKLFKSMQTDINAFEKPLKEICSGLSFTDKDNEPYIEFRSSDLSKMGHAWVFKKFENIQEKRLVLSNDADSTKISFPLFSSIEDKAPFIRCYFSSISLRYLLYFGIGVGGCFFNVLASLHMRTALRQRLYRLVCSNRTKKEFTLKISTFKSNFNVPDYDFFKLKEKILNPFVEKLAENPYDSIIISYEPVYEQKRVGRPKVISIKFKILKKNEKRK